MTIEQLHICINNAEEANKSGNYNEAEIIANEALAELDKQDGTLREVETLRTRVILSLADTKRHRGNFTAALRDAEQALILAEMHNLTEYKPKAWTLCGNVNLGLSKNARALEYYTKALVALEELGDKAGAAIISGNIGLAYANLSEYAKAQEYYAKALATHEELGNKATAADVTVNIGLMYVNLSDYAKASECYAKALATHEELGNKANAAIVICNLGNVYFYLSDYARALEYYAKALATHEELGQKANAAIATGNIGIVYSELSDYARALEYYAKALATHEELGQIANAAFVMGSIGVVYSELSDYAKALAYYDKALSAHEELGDRAAAARVTGNIGNAYLELSDYPKALEYYAKSLKEHEELGQKTDAALVIGNIGTVYGNMTFNGYDAVCAEEYLLKAIFMNEQHGTKLYLYKNHLHISILYKQEHRWEEYAEHIEKYHQLYIEVQNEEVKKQADRFGWERKVIEMEKEKEIEKIKNEADKKILEETINFQKLSIEQQSRELKNTIEELVRKNTLLQHIQSDIKKIAPHTIREGTEHIKQLLDRVERNITPLESNQQLHNQLNEIHKDFMYNLHKKFPDLTIMELKIAALLSMKLTSSNIAAALFLSKRTVESHRLSLRKKCSIGKDDNIYEELSKYMV